MRIRTRDVATAAKFGVVAYLGLIAAVIGIAGITALVWWLSVAGSGVHGAGDVVKDQNSAANREHWSATFNAEYQRIQADQADLATLRSSAAGPGSTQQDRMDYQGAQLNCRQDVAEYNADAASDLGRPWIPAGLPTSILASTYCGS